MNLSGFPVSGRPDVQRSRYFAVCGSGMPVKIALNFDQANIHIIDPAGQFWLPMVAELSEFLIKIDFAHGKGSS